MMYFLFSESRLNECLLKYTCIVCDREDLKCPEDAVGEEIKNAVEKDQEIIVSVTTNDEAISVCSLR